MKKNKLNVKFFIAICFSLIYTTLTFGQQSIALTIEECYKLARQNYPLVNQMTLIEKTKDYTISNASKGYLPQINLNGQATYQSEVTELPISLPNVKVPALNKDQYKIYGEINESLTDAYAIKQQKELARANAETDGQKLEVELYKLKDRINQLFFGIQLIDGQIQQTELLKKDIQTGIEKTNALIENGAALKSNADLLKAELLKTNQRTIELRSNRKGYMEMLGLFINQKTDDNTQLEKPIIQGITSTINRPELKLYEIQKKSFSVQEQLLTAKNIPKLGLFFQGGYGRPALNPLTNEFKTYYLTGLRLNWNLSGFYTYKKEKQIINLNQNLIDLQKETFIFNTNLSMAQQNNEISKLQELINSDNEIIVLRQKIKTTGNIQLENGTITTNDYLVYVNAEDQARQNQLLHQIQLLLAQFNFQTISGN